MTCPVVIEARRWIGTPFVHGARLRGVGCDCIGLVFGAHVAAGLLPPAWWTATFDPVYRGYSRSPTSAQLDGAMRLAFRETEEVEPGCVVTLSIGRRAIHAAIVAPYDGGGLSLLHCLHDIGVREHRLCSSWRSRVAAAWCLDTKD